MHLNILLSLTLFALVIQANCLQSSADYNFLDGIVKKAANKVSKAIENNPNAYRPLFMGQQLLYIPDANSKYGLKLLIWNGKADGLSSFQGENGNHIVGFGNYSKILVGFKFNKLSFTFNFGMAYRLLPPGYLQFIANDIHFDCSVKVESYSPLVLGEFLIANGTNVGEMELFLNGESYKEKSDLNFEPVLKYYAQKMSDYARETLSEYSYYLVEQLQEQLSDLPRS